MKILIYLDACLPDYFNGHHNHVLIAYYDKTTTISDIFEQLENDTNNQELTCLLYTSPSPRDS